MRKHVLSPLLRRQWSTKHSKQHGHGSKRPTSRKPVTSVQVWKAPYLRRLMSSAHDGHVIAVWIKRIFSIWASLLPLTSYVSSIG